MPSGSINKSFSFPGYSFGNPLVANVTFDHAASWEISLPAGKAVTAWVKTDADTAACNFSASHGQTNGKYDVYWTIAGVNYVRYGVDGTITVNALALDGGAGDAFPASATTGVVVCKQVPFVCNVDGDNVKQLGLFFRCSSDTAALAHVDLQDSGPASIEEFDLTEVDNTANGLQHGYLAVAAVALLTGNVIVAGHASNSSVTATGTLFICTGVDSTP